MEVNRAGVFLHRVNRFMTFDDTTQKETILTEVEIETTQTSISGPQKQKNASAVALYSMRQMPT